MEERVISKKRVGALTNKSYAFRARSWEIRTLDSFDIFDVVGSAIRIDVRGMNPLRILPRIDIQRNADFITDKVRYSIDGFYKARLDRPKLRMTRDSSTLLDLAWAEALFILGRLVSHRMRIDTVFGKFTDIELAQVITRGLCNKGLLNSFSLYDGSPSLPLLKTSLGDLSRTRTVVLIGLNIRLELPLLNLAVRRRVALSKLRVLHIGYGNWGQSFETVGSTTLALTKFLLGNMRKSNLLKASTAFLLGTACLRHRSLTSIFGLVSRVASFCRDTNMSVVGESLAHYTLSALGIPQIKYREKAPVLLLQNVDEVRFSSGYFILYNGHHVDQLAPYANLVLPGELLYERGGRLVNYENKETVIPQSLKSIGLALSEVGLWKKLLGISFSDIVVETEMHEYKARNPFVKGVFFNTELVETTGSYYLNNSVSRASFTMVLAAKAFAPKNNFDLL